MSINLCGFCGSRIPDAEHFVPLPQPDHTCKTCKHWEPSIIVYATSGECHKMSIQFDSEARDHAFVPGDCQREIFTGPDFGCIHHEPKGDAR